MTTFAFQSRGTVTRSKTALMKVTNLIVDIYAGQFYHQLVNTQSIFVLELANFNAPTATASRNRGNAMALPIVVIFLTKLSTAITLSARSKSFAVRLPDAVYLEAGFATARRTVVMDRTKDRKPAVMVKLLVMNINFDVHKANVCTRRFIVMVSG